MPTYTLGQVIELRTDTRVNGLNRVTIYAGERGTVKRVERHLNVQTLGVSFPGETYTVYAQDWEVRRAKLRPRPWPSAGYLFHQRTTAIGCNRAEAWKTARLCMRGAWMLGTRVCRAFVWEGV